VENLELGGGLLPALDLDLMGLPSLDRQRWRSNEGLDSFPRQSGTRATRLVLAQVPQMDQLGRLGRKKKVGRRTIGSIKHRSTSPSPFLLTHHSTQDITRRPNIFPNRRRRCCVRIGSGGITPIHKRHKSSSCTWIVGSYLTLIPCEIACWDIGDLGHSITRLLGECG
jgi:hypothetical protein